MNSITATCDRFFSQLVRARGCCERCGSPRDLECAHILSRTFNGTRWDELNALALCLRCHRWAHHRPWEFQAWIGAERLDALYRKAHPKSTVDPVQIAKQLRAALKEAS